MKILPILFLLFFTFYTMANNLPTQLDPSNYSATGYWLSTSFLIFLFLITLLFGKLFITYTYTPHFTKTIFNNNQVLTTSSQTAFVFDLHGVVFRFNPIKAACHTVNTKHKRKLVLAVLNPFLIWNVLKLLYTSSVVEEAIMAIGHKYPQFKDLIPLALQMANEQTPIIPTVELIKQIKTSGFKVLVFSNIGEQSAAILQTKYPEIFELFDGLLFTSPQDNYIMKPSKQAFSKFFNKFKINKDQIIFIDDKRSNVNAAQQMGINAIQFISPYQCRRLITKFATLK